MLIDEQVSPVLIVIKCYLKPFLFSKDCGCTEILDRLKYTKGVLVLKFGESFIKEKEEFGVFWDSVTHTHTHTERERENQRRHEKRNNQERRKDERME